MIIAFWRDCPTGVPSPHRLVRAQEDDGTRAK